MLIYEVLECIIRVQCTYSRYLQFTHTDESYKLLSLKQSVEYFTIHQYYENISWMVKWILSPDLFAQIFSWQNWSWVPLEVSWNDLGFHGIILKYRNWKSILPCIEPKWALGLPGVERNGTGEIVSLVFFHTSSFCHQL